MGQRFRAQFGIRVGAKERSARVVEVHAPRATRGIIQGFAQRPEIGHAARQFVERRRITVHRKAAVDASVEH